MIEVYLIRYMVTSAASHLAAPRALLPLLRWRRLRLGLISFFHRLSRIALRFTLSNVFPSHRITISRRHNYSLLAHRHIATPLKVVYIAGDAVNPPALGTTGVLQRAYGGKGRDGIGETHANE